MTTAKKALRVYGFSGFPRGMGNRQCRIIVAAPSMAEVARATDNSYHHTCPLWHNTEELGGGEEDRTPAGQSQPARRTQ